MLDRAALIPPCAAMVCERVGNSFVMHAQLNPAALIPWSAVVVVVVVHEVTYHRRTEPSSSRPDNNSIEGVVDDRVRLRNTVLRKKASTVTHLPGPLLFCCVPGCCFFSSPSEICWDECSVLFFGGTKKRGGAFLIALTNPEHFPKLGDTLFFKITRSIPHHFDHASPQMGALWVHAVPFWSIQREIFG